VTPTLAAPPAADSRTAAFTDPFGPEVFHSIASPTDIGRADPDDVAAIHAAARAAFARLLDRAGRTPPAGAVLVLLGEAGSGKTHLMRAFRTDAHAGGAGYCAYMQMTTEAGHYARYMLTHLLEGLEQPYAPPAAESGLARLSAAVLALVPDMAPADLDAFRHGEGDPTPLVDDFADRLHATARFADCDLELLRVVLHLQLNKSQVRTRALMWLRGQEMRPQDRDWIGGAVPRADDAAPMAMLRQLAALVAAVTGGPLVVLIDQLEDMANQSAAAERFLKVVDAVTAITDQAPNAVVVLACLEDYFKANAAKLTKSKEDRLIRDPEPVRLLGQRTPAEVRAIAARRLARLYATAGVETAADDVFPFREAHFARLGGLRTRDALAWLRKHQERCFAAGQWEDPADESGPPEPAVVNSDFDQTWNDFASAFAYEVPDGEDDLARVIADAAGLLAPELPAGCHFGVSQRDGRFIEIERHQGNRVDKVPVAVCNADSRGGGLGKQITEAEKRFGDLPLTLVRSAEYPANGATKIAKQIRDVMARGGRRVTVADADWRRMAAFQAFRVTHGARRDFAAWQQAVKPLSALGSLQLMLGLTAFVAAPAPAAPPPAEPLPVIPAPVVPPPAAAVAVAAGPVALGVTLGLTAGPVAIDPQEFIRHAAVLGGSGSGKTTAAMNLIEQLLARGVPAVLLDRKGDLCRYADPAAWDRPLDGRRAAERAALRAKLDVAVFTPGEPAGRPLVLPVIPPGFAQLPPAERERFAQYAAAALGSMIGFKTSDADQGQRAILAKAIEALAAASTADITVPALREVIERQDAALMAAIGGAYPDRLFATLAQRLLTLLLNNRQLLTDGETLDIDALLGVGAHAAPGRVRLSVVSTKFLGDGAKTDFWVSQFLTAVTRWCDKAPQPSLRAVFLFDEADRYLPAVGKPATKEPMEHLLKRSRSAGVGVFLATQSPGDLDYKCKENVATWLIGKVSQPQALNKLKPLLAAARGDVTAKVAGQQVGEFHLVRDSGVTAVTSHQSLVVTEQLPEQRIAELAKASARP